MDTRTQSRLRSISQRRTFFQTQVKMPQWKDSMAGKNEDSVIEVLQNLGYKKDIDFVRQHPIGERFVIDIAFIKEQIAIEVDGSKHSDKKQKNWDRRRDNFLFSNNWVSLRIKDKEFFGYKGSFYKSLIKEIVDERREQWEKGFLYPIDVPEFEEKDYD